jgi:two-component system, OmpR family, phosphate regulon sensor histidine kinase PhoR
MRKKIFVHFTLAIISSVVLCLIVVTIQTQRFYRKDIAATLNNIANSIDSQLSPLSAPDLQKLAVHYSNIFSYDNLNIRVTFIDFDGKVLGESDHDPEEMDNHLERKEIADALSKGFGSSVRYSNTLNYDLMYAAIRSDINQIVVRVAVPLKNITGITSTLLDFAFFAAALGIIISLLLAYTLSRYITRSVKVFSDTSMDIYKGDLDKRVDLKTSDKEISTLAYVFNNMADKLQQNIKDLTDDNIKITSIIDSMIDGLLFVDENKKVLLVNKQMKRFFDLDDDRSYRNKDLIDVVRNRKINEIIEDSLNKGNFISDELKIPVEKKDLIYRLYTAPVRVKERSLPGIILFMQDITEKRKLEQMRSDFVSNVSHELKTPLTSIKGFIETLKEGALEDRETALKFLDIIEIESERLSALIDDILSLSEIEHGFTTVNIQEADLYALTNDVFGLLSGIAKKRNITLINQISPGTVIRTDEPKFSQLLINLVDNAIKYNTENGAVKISSNRLKGIIEIIVEDSGIGIEESQLDRIFERFYRVDKGRSKDEGGTGLGLSIAKHLAKILNGDIKVKSELEKGSVFTITFPQ